MRAFLVRHGQSLANIHDRICSLPETGTLPTEGLSDAGKQQVQKSAEAIIASLPSPTPRDAVIQITTSDFTRAYETASILRDSFVRNGFTATNLAVDARLRERNFGAQLEGKSGHDWYEKVWAQDALRIQFEGVETPESVAERANSVVKEVVRKTAAYAFFVAHGDTLQILQTQAKRNDSPVSCWDHRTLQHLETAEIRETMYGRRPFESIAPKLRGIWDSLLQGSSNSVGPKRSEFKFRYRNQTTALALYKRAGEREAFPSKICNETNVHERE
ncbi:histidine phosphatase superfamily [Chytriomyces sp. MP71]|nr:histidine phosphatase superfamily [Chytriomyces sp. MP71]